MAVRKLTQLRCGRRVKQAFILVLVDDELLSRSVGSIGVSAIWPSDVFHIHVFVVHLNHANFDILTSVGIESDSYFAILISVNAHAILLFSHRLSSLPVVLKLR